MKLPGRINGFSLIELVSVIILLGIVATVVFPRFSSRDGFAEYAIRDQFISLYRLAQQRAMYDHSANCYSINVDNTGFSAQRNGVTFGTIGKIDFSGDFAGYGMENEATSSNFTIYFDGLGNSFTDTCGGTAINSDPYSISISPGSAGVEIYSTGFIRTGG